MSLFPIHNILFLDIETVPQYSSFDLLPEEWKNLWELKSTYLLRNKENETSSGIYERAGIYAEFGKIICIGCGVIQGTGDEKKMTVKSFCGDDEKLVLHEFGEMLDRWANDNSKYLCAHNGREFDFPYLCRRFVVNSVSIPNILKLSGKKPWEVNHLDTLDLWKFGDYKNYTSLSLLACTLGIPTPKDDIDGSKVASVYWNDGNLPRIVQYCCKDVITVAQVFLRMHGEELIRVENIEIK